VKYVYNGPGPHEDPELGLVRPGDEREFGAEPAWGPWLPIAPEPADPAPGRAPAPPPASQPPAAPAAQPDVKGM